MYVGRSIDHCANTCWCSGLHLSARTKPRERTRQNGTQPLNSAHVTILYPSQHTRPPPAPRVLLHFFLLPSFFLVYSSTPGSRWGALLAKTHSTACRITERGFNSRRVQEIHCLASAAREAIRENRNSTSERRTKPKPTGDVDPKQFLSSRWHHTPSILSRKSKARCFSHVC